MLFYFTICAMTFTELCGLYHATTASCLDFLLLYQALPPNWTKTCFTAEQEELNNADQSLVISDFSSFLDDL